MLNNNVTITDKPIIDDIDETEILSELQSFLNITNDDLDDVTTIEDLSLEDLDDELTCIIEEEVLKTMQTEMRERFDHLSVKTRQIGGKFIVSTPVERPKMQAEEYLSQQEKDDLTSQFYPNLVHRFAHKYYATNTQIEYEDLFSEATVGFTKALNTYTIFNRENAVPFANYACMIMDNVLRNYLKADKIHVQKIGRTLSLNTADNTVENATLGDAIPDITQIPVDEQAIERTEADFVEELCDIMPEILTEMEEFAIKSLYGVGGCSELSIPELMTILNRSKYLVNRLIDGALDKMRVYIKQNTTDSSDL